VGIPQIQIFSIATCLTIQAELLFRKYNRSQMTQSETEHYALLNNKAYVQSVP